LDNREYALIRPADADRVDALAYKQEFLERGELICGSCLWLEYQDYEAWVRWLADSEAGRVPEGRIGSTTYFTRRVSDGRIVGIVDIRHSLSPFLLERGGHIGYSVRPSERRKGVATAQLALALEKCRQMGIQRVLVTCDKENLGSARTIQKNGGVLENEVGEGKEVVQRYWIDI
jgi:predicted acetyltransferase